MIDIKKAMKSERLMKPLTGLKIKHFRFLIESFGKNIKKSFKKNRNVNSNLGRDFILKTNPEKLFYILFYVKCYPTFDLAAFIFNVDKSTCCRWTHWFIEALKITLKKEIVLPQRKINDIQNLLTPFHEIKEIYVDGTERPIRRPKNSEAQKDNYSGKKKRHTKKNLNINVVMPKKKPKGKNLSQLDISENKLKSQKRVLVENALSGVKRLKIVSDVFRNYKKGFVDLALLISCGIWNYYLKATIKIIYDNFLDTLVPIPNKLEKK
jgi:hypothetical protein